MLESLFRYGSRFTLTTRDILHENWKVEGSQPPHCFHTQKPGAGHTHHCNVCSSPCRAINLLTRPGARPRSLQMPLDAIPPLLTLAAGCLFCSGRMGVLAPQVTYLSEVGDLEAMRNPHGIHFLSEGSSPALPYHFMLTLPCSQSVPLPNCHSCGLPAAVSNTEIKLYLTSLMRSLSSLR